MSRKNYKVDEVIRTLTNKGVIISTERGIKRTLKIITSKMKNNEIIEVVEEHKNSNISPMNVVLNNAKGLGNGSWGKIDFLEHYCNFTVRGRGVYKKRLRLE